VYTAVFQRAADEYTILQLLLRPSQNHYHTSGTTNKQLEQTAAAAPMEEAATPAVLLDRGLPL
jgi:hypothetical protein